MYPGLAGIPIIVITGEPASVIQDRGIPKEIPILPKPFDFGLIAREIFRFEWPGRNASAAPELPR